MALKDALHPHRIRILESSTKDQVLSQLVELLGESGDMPDKANLKQQILYREQLMSTGIGLGIAVPHVRMEGVKAPIVAIGICRGGVPDYESIDDSAVKIVVMIVAGKDQHREYIRLLSEIVSKLKGERMIEQLLKAESPEEICGLLVGDDNV